MGSTNKVAAQIPDDLWRRLVQSLTDGEISCLPNGPGNLSRYEKAHRRSEQAGATYVLHEFGLLQRYENEAQVYAEQRGFKLRRPKPWSTLDLVDVAARKMKAAAGM